MLEGLALNDRKVVETIYRDNYPVIQSFILNNNGNSDEARDIFQEAMIVIYEKAVSGNFELNCLLKTYLYSVCRRLWLKRLHQLQRYGSLVENIEETVAVEEDLELHEKHNTDFILMETAMNKIGEPCKSLLDAYYLQKKNMHEIPLIFTTVPQKSNQGTPAANGLFRWRLPFFGYFFGQAKK